MEIVNTCVVEHILESQEAVDVYGAIVRKATENVNQVWIDPFLLLDYFKLQRPNGFPAHPHRGFISVTYLLEGCLRHEDSCGNIRVLNPGDIQWMSTGRGLLHSEMPEGEELARGVNVWINLSRKNKMMKPRYQYLRNTDLPKVTKDDMTVTVLVGEWNSVKSPFFIEQDTMIFDIKLERKASFVYTLPEGLNIIIYILSGAAIFGPLGKGRTGRAYNTLILCTGNRVEVKNNVCI